MLGSLWVVLLVALTGSQFGSGSPVRSAPEAYPHEPNGPSYEGWPPEGGLYAAIPVLALVLTAVGLLFGCTWCYRHKDCKLFTASATHLHDGRRSHPPDSGFSEPATVSEDNNNGPISLREMQNIANNNAAAYIITENEERNRDSRESVVEFEPLPSGIRVQDPLEHCADWFGGEDFPRPRLQYIREIGRGWFGRVVEGEIEEASGTSSVAVKILNQNATLEDKARFLDESRMYRDSRHENILRYTAKCLQEDPWILIFELCSMDLQQYLEENRPKMAILNESGAPLRILCDVTSALAYLHSRGQLYGNLCSGSVLVRGTGESARGVLGRYADVEPESDNLPPEATSNPPVYTASSEVWALGSLAWRVCAWGAAPGRNQPPPPDLPCPYRAHLYQVMQLCWAADPATRPTVAQVLALLEHLAGTGRDPGPAHASTADFELRWQRLKPNTIPKLDEHVAIVHAPSTSTASDFETSQTARDSLSADMDTAVSRSSSIMSDKDPLSVQIKSESLTNLHGSLEDVRNIYLTHDETATIECHQGNITLEDARERDRDRSDSSVDPWLKDIIAGSQDDVSYYRDVSDVIKNLDNILNSEKTSSSESSHQASPSRDNLSLDCKKDYPMPSSMVKSPGITDFQNILDTGFSEKTETEPDDDDLDRDTIGTLSHSFERHSEDTISQHTLENLTPETPIKDLDIVQKIETQVEVNQEVLVADVKDAHPDTELPNDNKIVNSNSEMPMLKELCVATIPTSASDTVVEQFNITKDCPTSCDSKLNDLRTDIKDETKSIDDIGKLENVTIVHELADKDLISTINHVESTDDIVLPKAVVETTEVIEEGEKCHNSKSDENQKDFSELPESNKSEQDFHESVKNENPSVEDKASITSDLVDLEENPVKPAPKNTIQEMTTTFLKEEKLRYDDSSVSTKQIPERVQSIHNVDISAKVTEQTETLPPIPSTNEDKPLPELPPVIVQNIVKIENEMESNKHLDKDVIDDFITSEEQEKTEVSIVNETDSDKSLDKVNKLKETAETIPEITSQEIISTCSDVKNDTIANQESTISPHETIPVEKYEVISECLENIPNETTFKTDSEPEANIMISPIVDKSVRCVDLHDKNSAISRQDELNIQSTSVQETMSAPNVVDKTANTLIIPETEEFQNILETPVDTVSNEDILAPVQDISNITPAIEEDILSNKSIEEDIDVSKQEHKSEKSEDVTCVVTETKALSHTPEPETVSVEDSLPANLHNEKSLVDTESPVKVTQASVICINESNTVRNDTSIPNVSMEVVEEKKSSQKPDDQGQIDVSQQSEDSTIYMDLSCNTNNKLISDNTQDGTFKDVIKSSLATTSNADNDCYIVKNESTAYLDLPSFSTKDVDNFLHSEKVFSSNNAEVVSSTPLVSDSSTEAGSGLDNSTVQVETLILCETKVPDGPGTSLTKLEQKYVPENLSPFESPTKSHHTDTYDENSSVVLGPFENSSLELFKSVKPADLVDIPKEELLAFSSNFSEINLETPSPLRDGNFLNEVPDIAPDDLHFDDIQSVSDKQSDPQTDTESVKSATEKHISPSTPPNSPGIFLASTSQQKYLVDIDLSQEPRPEPDLSLQKEIDLNQIQLQITSKLAMAENENNLNIEYSGPLTVEGLVSEEGGLLRESDALPESYLAGNGGSVEDLREGLTLDEECVQALRNELELKLPLAQVAAIEPPCENDQWSSELPPPPELIVSYPGALSPIAEETGQQLSAYENDANWNTSTRTDSSESYPEPCNNSTDEVTELPTGANSGPQEQSTDNIPSRDDNTYTVEKDILDSQREITMSADSLNASPYKKPTPDVNSPIDDKTYTKQDDEKESTCEHISQVSPFLLSPVTDTSAPEDSDNLDNATGVSTLSKTTLPTDAKLSKPSETQCLSKATSIDSWCSNDTLYNVEENFDDLAMDTDLPEFQAEKEEANSESSDTLTHNDDEKEISHCSTYIVHDSKSEACETFSPDSITANDNYTYTKVKTEHGNTPSATKSDVNDSTKNSQTKDLAYGTLMSGIPSYSNCTTEIMSGLDDWKLNQPEMVRKSPMCEDVRMTPPRSVDDQETEDYSPQLNSEPCVKKMDSVEISCLQDELVESQNRTDHRQSQAVLCQNNSPNCTYKSMAPSVTSTPIFDVNEDANNTVAIPMTLPQVNAEMSNSQNLPNFQMFLQSAEIRPQDLSSNVTHIEGSQTTEVLLDGDSNTLSSNIRDTERTPTYSDFEHSAMLKPQDTHSRDKSSQSVESGISSIDFTKFENSVRSRPQDLSSTDASSLLLKSERLSSELALTSVDQSHTSQSTSQVLEPQSQSLISPPIVTNLTESHNLVNFREPSSAFLINFDADDESEQPHSIIITETSLDAFKYSPSKSYDSHELKPVDGNYTFDTHSNILQPNDCVQSYAPKVNGEVKTYEDENVTDRETSETSDKCNVNPTNIVQSSENIEPTPNGSQPQDKITTVDAECNGSEKFATVNFIHESFEELIESNVDDGDSKDLKIPENEPTCSYTEEIAPESIKSIDGTNSDVLESPKEIKSIKDELREAGELTNGEVNGKLLTATDNFLQNEKKFCQVDTYLPLMSDIRFTGPATEIMSTSFSQHSPTSPTSPECEQDSKPDTAADILKEWDSDTDSHSSNSSSGEFIWKGGDGHETAVVPSTHFDSQRSGGSQGGADGGSAAAESGAASSGSGDSGSGSEGDEVEFVPSSWDCRAAPAKSSLRSLEQATPEHKKRVVFKRQKYHCVYEYPREAGEPERAERAEPAAYLPDLSTYCDWEPSSAEEAELGYGRLFGGPSPLDLYPLRAGLDYGTGYDEDFFISSSARPFESLGIMSTTSQFFPGKHAALLPRDDFPPPPSPLHTPSITHTQTPSLDFTTPDSGVEDITPGSTTDEDFKKKLPETELTWRPVDSASSSESVSPSSPAAEALGGLRHTRDKLKLDLPPSPHVPPSPRHNRVFNFVLDKPKRPERAETTPLVMTDETPVVTTALPVPKDDENAPVMEPTFSTFGKSLPKVESEQKIILDEVNDTEEVKVESPKVVEAVKGEGTVLDSGDEDSGIESSSKATLERNKTNVS